MNQPSPALPPVIFAGQLAALRHRVETVNSPGNLEGLFARYVLGSALQRQWRVDPDVDTWRIIQPIV